MPLHRQVMVDMLMSFWMCSCERVVPSLVPYKEPFPACSKPWNYGKCSKCLSGQTERFDAML